MDAAWPSPMGVNPRDLELNHDVSYDHNISTSFQGPPAHSSNGTHYCYDSWPSEPAPTGSFMPIALAGPHLEIGAFDVGMPATGGDFHVNGTIGIPVDNDDIWYLQGRQEGYGGIGHSTPGVGPTSQQALPLFTCSSLEQTSNTTSQFSNKDRVAMTVPPPADSQDSQETSSTHPLNHIPSQPQRIRRIRRDSVKASRTRLSRSMTSPMLRSRRPLPPQKRVPPLSDLTQSKILKGARSLPSTQSSLECPIEKSASNNHTTVLREGIALVHETIKPFSLFSRRKATDLIKQVVRLVDQLDQLAAEEEKYGNASDDDESNEPSTATSSQDSLSNSELVDVDSETDNTSISSTSRQPIIESQESVTMNNGQHEPVHHPCLQCGNKSLYYCTRENCKYSTHSPAEWRRHEQSQKHSQRERFMCLECPQSPPGTDVNGDPVCEFCRTSIPELGIHLTAHYLQCQAAQRSCTTYGRKDRLIAHLRTQHRIVINTSPIAASGRFTIDCQWPRQCGFCRVTFMAWDERMDHIARHFEDGLDMSSWKLPLHPPEDLHPGFKPQPKDGSDSDDDMDDNDSPPSHYKPGIQNKSTFSSSSKTRNPTQQQRRSASHQGGRRHRQQVPLADLENEADSDATSNPEHICGILALEWIPNGTSAPGRKTTSVALDRYLKDVEEPFQAQVITQNSVLPKESSNQDTTIAPEGADQKKEFTGNQKHEASKSRDWQPSPTLQIPPRTQNRFDQILIPAKFSRYQPRSPTQGSTSSSSLQTLRASKPAADTPMKYTSRTDRSSRARKGVPVHTCDICLPVKTFTRNEHLRRHQLSHQKPAYPCNFEDCKRAFHRPDLLARHESNFHKTQRGKADKSRDIRGKASLSSSESQALSFSAEAPPQKSPPQHTQDAVLENLNPNYTQSFTGPYTETLAKHTDVFMHKLPFDFAPVRNSKDSWQEYAGVSVGKAGASFGSLNTPIPTTDKTLIKGPEAAASSTLHMKQEKSLAVGDAFVISGAGGGTMDLAFQKIQKLSPSPEEEEWEFQMTRDLERRLSLIPSRNHGNTFPTLPAELQLEVFSYLDKIDSCCLGLSAPNLYLVYRAIHGTKMPRSMLYDNNGLHTFKPNTVCNPYAPVDYSEPVIYQNTIAEYLPSKDSHTFILVLQRLGSQNIPNGPLDLIASFKSHHPAGSESFTPHLVLGGETYAGYRKSLSPSSGICGSAHMGEYIVSCTSDIGESDTDDLYNPKSMRTRKRTASNRRATSTGGSRRNPKYLPAKGQFSCNSCDHLPFKDSSALQRHNSSTHTRPFICVFAFSGCKSTFASKNEWKRHVSSQHLDPSSSVCQLGTFSKPSSASEIRGPFVISERKSFSRKDLFAQHLRRMHAPFEAKRKRAKSPNREKWSKDMTASRSRVMTGDEMLGKSQRRLANSCESAHGIGLHDPPQPYVDDADAASMNVLITEFRETGERLLQGLQDSLAVRKMFSAIGSLGTPNLGIMRYRIITDMDSHLRIPNDVSEAREGSYSITIEYFPFNVTGGILGVELDEWKSRSSSKQPEGHNGLLQLSHEGHCLDPCIISTNACIKNVRTWILRSHIAAPKVAMAPDHLAQASSFKCEGPGCIATFRRVTDRRRHVTEVHSPSPLTHCHIRDCKWSTPRPSRLRRHLEIFHLAEANQTYLLNVLVDFHPGSPLISSFELDFHRPGLAMAAGRAQYF